MRAYELDESAVDELKNRLPKLKRHNYDTIDRLMQHISVKHRITGKKLHDMFVSKYGHTPDTWIKKYKNKLGEEGVPEGFLNEFAPNAGGEGGNYLKALASAWYNHDIDMLKDIIKQGGNALNRIIDAQVAVEKILARGIHCGDGRVRKYMIDYNHRFDGVDIQSDDHYEYADYDDAGRDIDSRTDKPWGPYDVVEFGGNELDESVEQGVAEDRLDELSPKTLGSYINKATKDAGTLGYGLGDINARPGKYKDSPDVVKDVKHSFNNRIKGVEKASHRLTKEQGVAEGSDSYTVANDPDKPGMHSYSEVGHAVQSGHSDAAKIYKNNKFLGTVGDVRKQGVAEGLPQTLRKVVPGHAKREIDKKMDAGKFGKTDADKDANFQRYKKIQDKLKEQGVAEGHADQQRRVFKKNGEPVGEVGIDRESSPGNGQWYMKYYPTGDDFGGYDSMEEAVADLKHLVNQFKAEGVAEDTDKYAELSKKIQDLAQAGKEGEANKLRYELNRLLMLDRDKQRRKQQGVAEVTKKDAIKQYTDIQNYKPNFKPKSKPEPEEFLKITIGNLNQKKSPKMNEGVEGPEDIQKIKHFIKWSYKALNIQKPYPKITISKNTEVAQKGHHTGVHKGNEIWVYVGNRNLIDIFRTIFHELTHHRQMQLNMIKDGDSYPGSPIEMLADMAAGKYIKIYGKDHPEMFQ